MDMSKDLQIILTYAQKFTDNSCVKAQKFTDNSTFFSVFLCIFSDFSPIFSDFFRFSPFFSDFL